MVTAEFTVIKPNIGDIDQIWALINHYVNATQELLPRSNSQILEHLRDFWIAVDRDRKVIGCASLFIWSSQLSEIKSLAIHPSWHGKGAGKKLILKCLQDAYELGQSEVFALTFKPEFFFKFGFSLSERNKLPHKVWNECIHCPKLLTCGEIAVSYNLTENKPVTTL
jgi:amino-acid N-acetyltransferase